VEELEGMGFRHLGRNVFLSRTARVYYPRTTSIGDHSIVDEFCVLQGNVSMGRNVHIAHGCRVIGGNEGISLSDFSGLAFGVTVFAQSDDYSGSAMTNPTVPSKYRKIKRARVEIGRHAIVGASSVIFPGVILGEGSSVGAFSMVTKSTDPWSVYFGVPAKKLKKRLRCPLELEIEYLNEE
jgi:acetyltransferase-like isoleucine patch superfamily enzyme